MISNFNLSEVAVAGMPGFNPSVVSVAQTPVLAPAHLPPHVHVAHPVAAAGRPAAAAISQRAKRRAAAATRASVNWSPF